MNEPDYSEITKSTMKHFGLIDEDITQHNTDGSKTSFYDCKGCNDVDDLTEHWSMKFDEGNCLKALVGIAKGNRHDGTTPLRDAKKLVHYANRILKRIEYGV